MSQHKFSSLLKERIKENAFKYLMGKQGSKGKESKYSNIEMAKYLMPTKYMLTIAQKQIMFSIKKQNGRNI